MSEPEPESGAAAVPKPAPRLGSYRLREQLGSGGMSNVFRAVHEETGSVVAVKVLPRSLAKNVMVLQRFLREAKSAEALDHPNVVSIYDRGFDQGRHYLVLEYVAGRDLHDRVRMNGPLGIDEAIRFIRQVAEGLQYASSLGMVHRDVKPANLLMMPDGQAKIIDLGLALQADMEDERVTRDGTTVGTVDYMAPEQARDSRQTSVRSDIYSLGCTFYFLLTGSPPYPGGGLVDKLARHVRAPIPDPREYRPDVSEALSLLIRRMMEKKPELRFSDYMQLIAALERLADPSKSGQSVALDALIVEDEDDEIGLVPAEPILPGGKGVASRPPSTHKPLMAEIVEDDDQPPSTIGSRAGSSHSLLGPSRPVEMSLSELASLDGGDDLQVRRQGRPPSSQAQARSRPSLAVPAGPSFEDLVDEAEEPVEGYGGSTIRRSGTELPLKTWIAAGLMVGLTIALVGLGVSVAISLTKPQPEIAVVSPREDPPENSIEVQTPIGVRGIGPNRPVRRSDPIKVESGQGAGPVTPTTVRITAREPLPDEKVYPSQWEQRLLPAPAPSDAALSNRPRVILRRVPEAGDEPQTSSPAAALSRSGDVVEVADTGPFYEDDCQVTGKARIIRSRPGIRPILKIEPTGQEVVRQQEAKFVLGRDRTEKLTIEGIDLAVDIRDLPLKQQSLFLCRGAEVTLRDCTITLINVADRPSFTIFRVEEGPTRNRITLERTLIRGPIRTLVGLTAAHAEIVLNRSVIVGDGGPLIASESADQAARSLFLIRSVIATRGNLIEWKGKQAPLTVKALGSTIARVDGGDATAMLRSRTVGGGPAAILDWWGQDNSFVGWAGWLTSTSETSTRVDGLDGIHATWPGSDSSSVVSAGPWPASIVREDVIPADFVPIASDRRGTLARVASPHPRLRDQTFGAIARLPAPAMSDGLIEPTAGPGFLLPGGSASHPGPGSIAQPSSIGAAQPLVDLYFDLQASPWNGDLGSFLIEKVKDATSRVVVHVRGSGTRTMSPVRFPDGLSIAILGEHTEASKASPIGFVPAPGDHGRAMFELIGGDLAVANLAFTSDASNRPRHWFRIEDGLFAMRHCRLRDASPAVAGLGAAVSFIARKASPIPSRAGPLTSATDRPIARIKNSLIWTGGDAISAEMGRGIVDLENCLIISGGPAITLLPQRVGRDKFEADLIMDRCTIADDRTGILLGPWPGEPEGPDRPWLVATRHCVFPRTQVGGAGGLLLVDPDAMARGTLFWQSFSDTYEVARFLATTGPQPAGVPAADLKKQWIDLWGEHHTRGDRGPDPRRFQHVLTYRDKERPRPGKVTPQSLELDPKVHKDLGVDLKSLPQPPKT